MKKILQICSYYVGSSLYEQLFHTLEKNIEEDVYIFVSKSYKGGNFPKNVMLSKNYTSLERLFFHLKHEKVWQDIRKSIHKEKYGLSHAHSLFSNGYIAKKLKEEYNLPYIVAVRNTDLNVFFKRMLHLRKLGVEIMEKAEVVIFISPSYLEATLAYLPVEKREKIRKKSQVISNGIHSFWHDHAYLGEKKEGIRAIYVGDMNKNKNLLVTLKALDHLKEKHMPISYHAIGKMKDKKVKKELSLRSYVTWEDYMPKEKLIRRYRDANIFVMPSFYETFGLVYVEAMSQGLPVIYTKNQGFDGYFPEGEVGYSVDPHSPEEIERKILQVFEDEKMRERAVEGSKQFVWEKIAEKYLAIYTPYLED